ncbi:hypothetical protein GH714_034318 [Hevea brasiliensis]|uniref:AP180 N-terminal homology (ANTH) domain-containing protein n=1 Tax=Hevea brasiliensis TaxID=3981 RepID=A0A6A6KWM5_HEVBR|nr:hypothetical protein GH714_034318 [Hevea brasiliensis]
MLSYGYSSRATAAAAIEALMDRLQSTHDSSVAIKCLAIVHHIIKDGSFILQDQLSVYPSTGGRNYLKLSSFRDNTTPIAWELSSWVRWEMKGRVENGKAYKEEGRLLLKHGGSESARFGERVLSYGDSVRFSSVRFGLNGYSLAIVESVESCA